MLIGINEFVRRQTSESRFSHFAGTEEELVGLVEANFANAQPGYRDGVMLVPVAAQSFFSGVVELTLDTPLAAEFSARREGEDPFVQVLALGGEKLPAQAVDVVLYRRDVLEEDGGSVSGAEWDIISLNARPTEGPEPLTPMAMARNMLGLAGGTAAEYSAEQFAEAIIYWSRRAMRG
jgi:hypothetical protein